MARGEQYPQELVRGLEEFNRREFYACHETLEALWARETGPARELCQGIIQIAVGFYHLTRGNYVGAVRSLQRGIDRLDRLDRLPDGCQSVAVGQLARESRAALTRLVQLGPSRVGQFDHRQIPRIALSDRVNQGERMQLDVAQGVLSAALAKAREMDVAVTIVVVDEGGHMVSMARMDGARFLTVEIAYGKANACIGFHRTGEEVAQFGRAQPAFVSALAAASQGRFFAALGSIRVVHGGAEVGAVGVSGGSAEQDHQIAQAGVDAVR